MKVQWTSLVDDARGNVDSRHYARHIPGNGEWAAVCEKHGSTGSLFKGGCAIMCGMR